METRFFSLAPQAPRGFEIRTPRTQDLLEYRVVLFAESLEATVSLLDRFVERVSGLIITHAGDLSCTPIGPCLHHLTISNDIVPRAHEVAMQVLNMTTAKPATIDESGNRTIETGKTPHIESPPWFSQSLFMQVFNSTPALMSISTLAEGRMLEVNDSFCRVLGFKREEVIGRTAVQLGIHQDDSTREGFVGALPRDNRFLNREFRIWTKFGDVKTLLTGGTTLSAEGQDCLFISGEDITDYKQVLTSLQEREAQLRSVFRAAPVGIGVVSNRVITKANKLLCEMVGYAEEELVGQGSRMLYETDEDFDYVGREKYRQIGIQGTGTVDTRWVCKDGHLIDVLLSSTPLDMNDLEKGVTFTALDITERVEAARLLRQSEAKFRGLVETTSDWIWEVDTEGKYTDVSPQVTKILGYAPEEIIGKTPADFLCPEFAERTKDARAELAAHRTPIVAMESTRLHKDGHQVVVETSSVPIFDEDGKFGGYRGLDRDITERKQAEIEKKHLEEQYHQAQKVESIGRLAGGVAHDLNNLLSPILGYSEILLDDGLLSQDQQESVQEILRAGNRSRDLVRQLLAFSRKQTLEYKTIDLNEIVINFEKLLRRAIREDIDIDIRTTDNLPLVLADSGQIEQVLMNLMVNAQDAMPGGGHLILETGVAELDAEYTAKHPGSEPGPYAMLVVSDTGTGMDDEVAQQIFEPFYSTKGELGTGLGLATVYGIVKQHGGNIWVYSEPNKGTTFKIYLPVSANTVRADTPEQKESVELAGVETVLIVEDNEQVRELASAILQRHGYRVMVAGDGPDAIRIFTSHVDSIDLLLTDVVLPDMNGKAVYEKLAELSPGLRVLYMSGYTDNVIVHRGVLQEGVDFIQKPFNVQALATKVREVLDRS